MSALALLPVVAGWGGAAVLLAAYGLSSTGRMPSASIRYQVLNVLGAAALIVQCLYKQAWPMVMLNGVWFGFGLATLLIALGRTRRDGAARRNRQGRNANDALASSKLSRGEPVMS